VVVVVVVRANLLINILLLFLVLHCHLSIRLLSTMLLPVVIVRV
jgi:hypothetical protein